jgi:tRNA pseudouridine13 synthase
MHDPLPGDMLVFLNGRTDTATATNLAAVSIHIKRGRCGIALFMPGKEMAAGQIPDATTAALLEEHQITPADFERAAKFVRTKFEGAYRPIALRTEIESSLENTNVRLKFTLPPGHYATTVCREFMKANPEKMI